MYMDINLNSERLLKGTECLPIRLDIGYQGDLSRR